MFRHFHRILDDTVINADDAAINADLNLLDVDRNLLNVDLDLLDADLDLLNVDLDLLNVDLDLLDVDLDSLDVDPVGITVDRAAIAFCTQNNSSGTQNNQSYPVGVPTGTQNNGSGDNHYDGGTKNTIRFVPDGKPKVSCKHGATTLIAKKPEATEGIAAGSSMTGLMKEEIGKRHEVSRLSPAKAIRAFSKTCREYRSDPKDETHGLHHLLGVALKDDYRRRKPKTNREYPRKSQRSPTGEPQAQKATKQLKKCAETLTNQSSGFDWFGGVRLGRVEMQKRP